MQNDLNPRNWKIIDGPTSLELKEWELYKKKGEKDGYDTDDQEEFFKVKPK